MQKTKGAISKNTLSLRFMQNAARAMQEQEVEASKAKVRTEEEWELPKELWGDTLSREDQLVTYEPSYLPFLFPGFGGSSSVKAPSIVDRTDGLTGQYQGRRKMSKQIEEELCQEDKGAQFSAPSKEKKSKGILLHGARSISRATVPSTKPKLSQTSIKLSVSQGFSKPSVELPQSKKRRIDQSDQETNRKRTKDNIS